jgi:predicted nucleotidyltransferase
MLSEADITRIAGYIARSCAPLAVGTFGSYAVGSQCASSDLDLFVIRDTTEAPGPRQRAIRSLLFGVAHPIDIHVFTPKEFEETAYEYLSFTWVIVRQAKLYHWMEDAKRRVPSLFAEPLPVARQNSDLLSKCVAPRRVSCQ